MDLKVWRCGHDNGTWQVRHGMKVICWCGVEAISEEEWAKLQEKEQAPATPVPASKVAEDWMQFVPKTPFSSIVAFRRALKEKYGWPKK